MDFDISSMTPFATPKRPQRANLTDPPWKTHWSKICNHELVPRLKKYETGLRAKMQCIKCGRGVGGNIRMAGVVELWDEQLERNVLAEYQEEERKWKAENDAFLKWQQGEKTRDWWQCYNDYLLSSVWQAKRLLVLERAGNICESCGQARATQVHHMRYPDTFGLEPLWDLRAVCADCHELIHPHMR